MPRCLQWRCSLASPGLQSQACLLSLASIITSVDQPHSIYMQGSFSGPKLYPLNRQRSTHNTRSVCCCGEIIDSCCLATQPGSRDELYQSSLHERNLWQASLSLSRIAAGRAPNISRRESERALRASWSAIDLTEPDTPLHVLPHWVQNDPVLRRMSKPPMIIFGSDEKLQHRRFEDTAASCGSISSFTSYEDDGVAHDLGHEDPPAERAPHNLIEGLRSEIGTQSEVVEFGTDIKKCNTARTARNRSLGKRHLGAKLDFSILRSIHSPRITKASTRKKSSPYTRFRPQMLLESQTVHRYSVDLFRAQARHIEIGRLRSKRLLKVKTQAGTVGRSSTVGHVPDQDHLDNPPSDVHTSNKRTSQMLLRPKTKIDGTGSSSVSRKGFEHSLYRHKAKSVVQNVPGLKPVAIAKSGSTKRSFREISSRLNLQDVGMQEIRL